MSTMHSRPTDTSRAELKTTPSAPGARCDGAQLNGRRHRGPSIGPAGRRVVRYSSIQNVGIASAPAALASGRASVLSLSPITACPPQFPRF